MLLAYRAPFLSRGFLELGGTMAKVKVLQIIAIVAESIPNEPATVPVAR
jgi:hypothetical protein